jgi:DNA mismatch repair ATPase MutL
MGRYGPTSGSGGDGYKSRGSGGRFKGDQTDDFFEERKRKRDNTNFSIWAGIPSPPPMKKRAKKEKMEPTPSPSRFRSVSRSMSRSRSDSRSRSRSSSRSFSDSESDVSSSESEDERRRSRKSTRKHKSKRRSHKKKSSKKSKKHKKESKSRRKRRRSPSLSEGRRSGSESDVSVASERKEDRKLSVDMSDVDENDNREAEKFKEAVQGSHNDEDEEEIGPKPLQTTEETAALSMNYGKALLPGEGAAIAQFVQKNMRIPRRGEVGWNGEEIENLENLGYVMSGSRHKRMNAVRIRKENQVYTAEEKRALALINFEEKQQRENAVMNDFKEMLTERLTKKHGSRLVEDMESSAKE